MIDFDHHSNLLFIMQGEEKEIDQICEQCEKKQRLIQKYLNLIDLLKKKNDKSMLSTTLKKSIDHHNSNSSHLHSNKMHRAVLAITLQKLILRRKLSIFTEIKGKSNEGMCYKGYFFVQTIERIVNRKMLQSAKKIFFENYPSLSNAKESILHDQQKKINVFDKSISRNMSYCSVSLFIEGEKKDKLKNATRKIFDLTQQLTLLKHQKKILQQQIEQNYRRQEVESKKKKESLEMLAEQMAEKNETINELQAALKFYEEKEGMIQNNVLEEDSLAMKREIQKIEKINEKLNIQLEKRADQLKKIDQQYCKVNQKFTKMEVEYTQLKERNFEMTIQLENLQRKKQQYHSLSSFIEKKLVSLKKYEKLISNNLKVIDQCSLIDKSSFNSTTLKQNKSRLVLDDPLASENNLQDKQNNKDFSPISKFQCQYKIEKILNYLFNIDLEDVWMNNEEKLFDNEELQVLNEVKLKFINIREELKKIKGKGKDENHLETINRFPARLSKQCGEQDEIYFNQHHVSGSIFDVFVSDKAHKQKENPKAIADFDVPCKHCIANKQNSHGDMTSRRDNQGFTKKLFQLQIQKSKQVEKISQLKNKLFHIRSIVMNLIKSLEVKNLKLESKDIIDVCFQVFEYSEEEKEIIFHTQPQKPQKKFLGLF